MSNHTFKECQKKAKDLEMLATESETCYWVTRGGNDRLHECFLNLKDLWKFLIVEENDQKKELAKQDQMTDIWNKQFDKRSIDLHIDTIADKAKAKKKK